MGIMKLTLPSDLSPEDTQELERACITSGPDGMPAPCQVHVDPLQLTIARELDESGHLAVPWRIKNAGQLMTSSATLVERPQPYALALELARGKVNQVRNQAAEWTMSGLNMPPALAQRIKEASRAFCRSVARFPADDGRQQAENALVLGCEAADELVHVYMQQVFQVRQQRQPQLDTILGCRLEPPVPEGETAAALLRACNGINIPFSLAEIAPTEDAYHWDAYDALVQWARQQNVALWAGPLLDCAPARIPDWLWNWAGDRQRLSRVLREYTTEVVDHYRHDITTWELTAAANIPGVLSLQEDELLWITLQMAEAARRTLPDIDLVVRVAQPWGDYLTNLDRTLSPFVFVDTLLRSGLSLGAINLEILMGVEPRGSYCRDLLELSRLLDLYALLGVPLQVTLGYPADSSEDMQADSEYSVQAGYWRDGIQPQTQADWAVEFASLALCKPYVRAVQWIQFSDARPHAFPNCGLFDGSGKPRPVLERLRKLREKYLH